jgi:hypothetical protein
MKLGIQTGEGIVTAILPTKVWRKLEQAAQDYLQWVAALSGSLDHFKDGDISLKHPALQIFEKKSKPPTASLSPAVDMPTPPVTPAPSPMLVVEATQQPPAPVESKPNPHIVRPTLRLKDKGRTAG